jgi:hypothetical protein
MASLHPAGLPHSQGGRATGRQRNRRRGRGDTKKLTIYIRRSLPSPASPADGATLARVPFPGCRSFELARLLLADPLGTREGGGGQRVVRAIEGGGGAQKKLTILVRRCSPVPSPASPAALVPSPLPLSPYPGRSSDARSSRRTSDDGDGEVFARGGSPAGAWSGRERGAGVAEEARGGWGERAPVATERKGTRPGEGAVVLADPGRAEGSECEGTGWKNDRPSFTNNAAGGPRAARRLEIS